MFQVIVINSPRQFACMRAKLLQSCLTLCDPMDCSLPVPLSMGFFRQEHWSELPFLLQGVKVKLLSRVRLFTTPWTAAYQAPPSMGFSRQEYWSGVPMPSLSICH